MSSRVRAGAWSARPGLALARPTFTSTRNNRSPRLCRTNGHRHVCESARGPRGSRSQKCPEEVETRCIRGIRAPVREARPRALWGFL
jgi:hypothetical protein